MNRILCSTGALIGRVPGYSYTVMEECLHRLDCDGFEFMMYDDFYAKLDDVSAYFAGFSKPFPIFHVAKNVGMLISRNDQGDTEKAVELFEKNCYIAQKIGADKLVLHLWSGVDSDKNFPHNIDMYLVLRKISHRYGLILTVENVVCGFADPMARLRELAQISNDIRFTFDTKMAEFHGQLELLYAEENRHIAERITHMHINDYKGGIKEWERLKTLHIGDGQIDFEKLFCFLGKINYSGDFTIESTSFDRSSGVIDFDKMNGSIHKVRQIKEKYLL